MMIGDNDESTRGECADQPRECAVRARERGSEGYSACVWVCACMAYWDSLKTVSTRAAPSRCTCSSTLAGTISARDMSRLTAVMTPMTMKNMMVMVMVIGGSE
jgi:hypothetical protein